MSELRKSYDGALAVRGVSFEVAQGEGLILTTFGRSGYPRRAMEGGASGLLLKDAPAPELACAT